MKSRGRFLAVLAGLLIAAVGGVLLLTLVKVRTVVEVRDPELPADEAFADDPVPAATPKFDPELVDSRRLAGREVNSSAAVIRLDVRPIRPCK
ncbi:MAG: hypothetical protein ACYTGB_14240, partial [Planctomycetota bacterium]